MGTVNKPTTSDFKVDGVDHIRLHLNAATELGRRLNEFYIRPFIAPNYGEFNHLVGYSLYLRTGKNDTRYRILPPNECLAIAKGLRLPWNKNFRNEYAKGIYANIEADPQLKDLLLKSTLPLVMYKDAPSKIYRSDFVEIVTEWRESKGWVRT